MSSLLELFECDSWRIAKGIVYSQGEDVLIVEMDGFDYPLWNVYFVLPLETTYGEVISDAVKLEGYANSLRNVILERL